MSGIIELLRTYPQIIIFLSIALGYLVGKVKIYGFNIGSTAGVLLVALVFGQVNVHVSPVLQAVMFAFFIFCIGYKVGPEFFSGLKKDGIRYIFLAFFVALVGLLTALLLGKLFHFNLGMTAGLLSGAMTQSAIIGTASEAINKLAISGEAKVLFDSDIAVAYAITYVFGTAGLVVFFKLVPRIMGIDLKAESIKIEQELSGGKNGEVLKPEQFLWSSFLGLRVYVAENSSLWGKTGAYVESLFETEVVVDSIKRNGRIIDSCMDEKIQEGDLIALIARPGSFLKAEEIVGSEVYDKELGSMMGEALKICVLNKDAIGRTLGDLSKQHGHGSFLKRIIRQGHEIPLTKNTVIKKCDELEVIGAKKDVERLIKYLGYPERPRAVTDLVLIGIGCVFGTLLGLIVVHLGHIPITLGIGGGVLFSGLICGWLRSRRPTFGMIPSGAQWILTDLGLNLFVVCIGLAAAPKALQALQTTGPSLFLAGVILTLTPMISGIIFGRYVLKINPVLLLGALTGAGTATAALNSVKEEAGSSVPALGYTVPYAFGNVLLTVWGVVIVYLMF